MKQGLLKRHFRLPVLVLIALAAVLPTHLFAETGTTIVFDKSSSHGLYSNGASNTTKANQWFAFLRHDIAHVQIIASNLTTLSDNGTGSFKQNANNLLFSDNLVKVSNWAGHYGGIYLAVVAPKGYRFTKYEWNIDGSTASEKMSNAYMQQYTYNGTSTSVVKKYELTNSTSGETFSNTLANGSNVLYFYLNTGQADGSSSSTKSFLFKSIKFTYVIDTPFESALPATDLSNNVHTGLLDLGTFTKNSASYNSFDEYRAATDTQEAKFYSESDGRQTTIDPTAVTVVDAQYYVTANNGTYYVEAPAKFRIIGATLNFLKSDATRTTYSYKDALSISSGSTYLITDGSGHYLNNDNGAISTGSDPNTATLWTITSKTQNKSTTYTIKNGNYYFINGEKGLALSTTSYSWSYSSSNGFYYTSGKSSYYLTYGASWTTSTSSGNIKLQTKTTASTTSYTGGDFTASVYGTDATSATKTVSVSDEATSQSVTLSGLNNDAVKFSISGLTSGANALYNVTLKLLPLNPELQNLSVATKLEDGEVTGVSSYAPENYTFNGCDGVTVVVPSNEKDNDHTLVFQDAYNENRTQWYITGTNASAGTADYSNYFLVNSTADNGGTSDVALNVNSTSYPTDRTTATQAGTAKLVATNIEEVDGGTATTLQDKAFSKTDASYQTAKVTPDATTASTYYIYTADVPTYTLLTSGTKHIDYRYYTLVVSCKSVSEEPTATVLPIYTSTLKGRNHKNTGILADSEKDGSDINADGKTAFYGVKVTIENQQFGYLTSKQVVDAVKAAVKQMYDSDSLRGMLYLDMSSLKSVDYDQFDADFHNSTADNCLYFMYPGFHRAGITNAIAKVSAKSNKFEAVSDIKIYDQQPFFTPYAFTTDTHSAIYEREGTTNNDGEAKDKVKKMAVVLPFDVQLDESGHMMTASDQTDEDITYYNLTGTGQVDHVSTEGNHADITFGFTKTAVNTGKAEANKPYYVETSNNEKGFSYKVLNASFAASGTVADDGTKHEPIELTNGMSNKFTATGTYAGEVISKDNSKWYFAKDLFWKSGALSAYQKFNVRPFRAYFTLAANTTEAKAIAVDASELTGISEVTANSLLDITANHGTITLKAQADTRFAVYTMAGQVVAAGQIAAGETRTVNVQQGVYIVNDKKTVVK